MHRREAFTHVTSMVCVPGTPMSSAKRLYRSICRLGEADLRSIVCLGHMLALAFESTSCHRIVYEISIQL